MVRQADFPQVDIRVKALLAATLKTLQKSGLVTAMAYEIRDVVGICDGEYDEVVTLPILAGGAGGGGARLLMTGLAVDD